MTVIGENTTNVVTTLTIPKTTVPDGGTPKVYVNSQVTSEQGFSQDQNNYYVWYRTFFRDYELSIVFAPNAPQVEVPLSIILVIIVVILLFSTSITAVFAKKRKKNSDEDLEYSTY